MEVWEKHNMLVRRAYRLTENWHDAEDLASQTVLRALEIGRPRIDNIRAWLFFLLKRKFIDYIRGRKRISAQELTDWLTPRVEPVAYDQDLLEDVMALRDKFTEREHSVLVLAALGNNCIEIGDRLGISYHAATSRWHDASRKLDDIVGGKAAKARGPKTSRFRGVMKEKRCWRVSFRVGKKFIRKSGFATEVDAARAYDELAKHHLGALAILNNILEVSC